jgi:Asp-tRNA(Asn)/Glu-tRNA(Gln) amidotransferase A subunit family amidase
LEKAVGEANRGTEEARLFHQDWDVLLTATTGAPPLISGHPDQSQSFEAMLAEVFAFVPYTYLANMTGCPAMSVPLHWNGEGLPIGCQFAGRMGEEALLFQLARALEGARPWAERWPQPPAPTPA